MFKQMIFIAFFMVKAVPCAITQHIKSNRSEYQIFFPKIKETERQEIPLDLIRSLNLLSSADEFFRQMVEHQEPDLSDRMDNGPLEKSSLKAEKTGKCMPEYTTVPLQPYQTTTTFYYPRCTRVKRCGGCCLHDLFTCRPVETEIIPITVIIAEYVGGHNFRLRDKKIVEIEQHKKCECGCRTQPQDCTKYQRYNAERCRCECPNSEKEKRCFKKIWNSDICSCICRNELTCGTGFDFDPFTCSCIPSGGRKKPGFMYRVYT